MAEQDQRPTRRGRPRKSDAARRSDAFLDHCLQQFLAQGYRSTTMDGLARSFGAGKSTLYAHYGSKAGLVRAAMERGLPALVQTLSEVTFDSRSDPREVLRAFGAVLQSYASEPGVRAMWRAVSEARDDLEGLEEMVAETSQRVLAPLSAYFEAMHAEGVLRCPEPEQTALAFSELASGGLNGFLGSPIPSDARAERLEFAVDLVLGGIGPGPDIAAG